MKLSAYNLAESNPFPDTPMGIHWYDKKHSTYLYDKDYQVGRVYPFLDKVMAEKYWGSLAEENEVVAFDSMEEAKAYLVATYRLER